MRAISTRVIRFLKLEDGPTAVEYAIMLAIVLVVCFTAIATLGDNASSTYSHTGTRLQGIGG